MRLRFVEIGRAVARRFLQVLFPWACAGCRRELPGVEDRGLCERCGVGLPYLDDAVCGLCGLPLKEAGGFCADCRRAPRGIRVRSAMAFTPVVQRTIHRFKYAGRVSLCPVLAGWMVPAFERYFAGRMTRFVPVPLHPRSHRLRGYNQSEILARHLSALYGLPVSPRLLMRLKRGQPQAKLNRRGRILNVRQAFALADPPDRGIDWGGESLLLIDDVCTTGSTLRACARALARLRPRRIEALTLARD